MDINDWDEPMKNDEFMENDDDPIKKNFLERFSKEMAKMINKLVVKSLGCRFEDQNHNMCIRIRNEEKTQRFFDEAL